MMLKYTYVYICIYIYIYTQCYLLLLAVVVSSLLVLMLLCRVCDVVVLSLASGSLTHIKSSQPAALDTRQRGVQSEGGAVDGGSII